MAFDVVDNVTEEVKV